MSMDERLRRQQAVAAMYDMRDGGQMQEQAQEEAAQSAAHQQSYASFLPEEAFFAQQLMQGMAQRTDTRPADERQRTAEMHAESAPLSMAQRYAALERSTLSRTLRGELSDALAVADRTARSFSAAPSAGLSIELREQVRGIEQWLDAQREAGRVGPGAYSAAMDILRGLCLELPPEQGHDHW